MMRASTARAHRQFGAVMVVTLLGIITLAALVMYVANLGQQANRRMLTQNDADATAIAGAGWVARSFNSVAMNNVAIARYLAAVAVIDAMPMAVDFTIEDQSAILDRVQQQQAGSLPGFWLEQGLDSLEQDLVNELAILEPMQAQFDSLDVRERTWYDTPTGQRGEFWQAMRSLDEQSQATLGNLSNLAQLNAVRGGAAADDRESDGSAQQAFLLPATPDIPWVRGSFDDFERPVRSGLLPASIDDKTYRRGPWDTVFAWRNYAGYRREGYWIPGDSDTASGGRGSVPIGSGAGGDSGRWVATGPPRRLAYSPYGPYSRMLRETYWYQHRMRHSRFSSYVQGISGWNLYQAFPRGREPRPVVNPEWVTDFAEAVAIHDAGTPRIRETAFVAVEIRSKHPRGHPSFGTEGTWAFGDARHRIRESPRVVRVRGWMDPRSWDAPKVADHIWRDEWSYTVFHDRAIGIERINDASGNPVEQPVYRIDDFVFVGVNVGENVTLENPFNFASREGLPAPTDLDHSVMGHDDESRFGRLTFLAVARRGDEAILWRDRHAGGKPYPYNVALAQAAVFNNHSWDLWTQMWSAQLEPVSRYDDWLTAMRSGDTSALVAADVPQQDFADLTTYLTHAAEFAKATLRH